MGIPLNSHCVDCLFRKHLQNAREYGSDAQAYAFAKDLMQIFLEAAPDDNSAILSSRINQLYIRYYQMPEDRFQQEKKDSNRFIMQRLDTVRNRVKSSDQPLLTALQYSIMGNYIDFSALQRSVSFDTFEAMLEKPEDFAFETEAYRQFCTELKTAKNLLILTDNAGELGFDWVLADAIAAEYPDLQITFCVRGMPVHNDATREDYAEMGIPYPVIDSGSNIGGTVLSALGEEARQAMEHADIIIAKGMGNTETLYGCDYNIYYAFLVKCKRFEQVFGKPHLAPMFVNGKSKEIF